MGRARKVAVFPTLQWLSLGKEMWKDRPRTGEGLWLAVWEDEPGVIEETVKGLGPEVGI